MGSPRTSSRSWQAALSRSLRRAADASRPRRLALAEPGHRPSGLRLFARAPTGPRVAVVGIGNELRGDDAAGVAVARGLGGMLAGAQQTLVLDGGLAPESCTGVLRRFAPDLVLFVDAADVGGTPGTVRLLSRRSLGGVGGSTHTLPLSLLAGYLVETIGCAVALVGIQPADTALGEPLSPAVGHAVREVATTLAELLGGTTSPEAGSSQKAALAPAG